VDGGEEGMSATPTIPAGFNRVIGRSQKGDEIWDVKLGKFVKVQKEFPHTAPECPLMIIRRCSHLDTQRVKKEVSKKKVRMAGAD
jgi:hypothetical protein